MTNLKKISDKRFDWFPVLEHEDLDKRVDELLDATITRLGKSPKGASKKKREKELREICQHLISALFSAYKSQKLTNEIMAISIPLNSSHYSRSQQGKVQYVYTDRVEAVFKALESLEWIDVDKGKYSSTKPSKVTTMIPSKKLCTFFIDTYFKWVPQKLIPAEKLVEVRKKNKGCFLAELHKSAIVPLSSLNEPRVIKRYQKELHEINAHLIKQCIHLSAFDDKLLDILLRIGETRQNNNTYYIIDMSCVQLRRIFSKGSLDRGGRLYMGWWQQVSGEYRPAIRINNEPTIEVDFSGIGINIIYALNGQFYDSSKDPYDVGLPDWKGKSDPRRPIIKKAFNAFINDEKGTYRLNREQIQVLGCNTPKLKRLIIKTHPIMSKAFKTDIGLHTQFIDSEIAIDVITEMLKQEITCLPIHDSFIVPCQHESTLKAQMKKSFKKIITSQMKKRSKKIMSVDCDVKSGVTKCAHTLHKTNKEIEQGGLVDCTHGAPCQSIGSNASLMDKYYDDYTQQKTP